LNALVFPYSSSAVVTQRALEKALAKVQGRGNALVVVGWDFTVEARALLESAKAVVLFDREFGWTDAMWADAKRGYRSPAGEHDLGALPVTAFNIESVAVARDFLLKGMPWDLSRPHFIDFQRLQIAEKVQADPMFATKLREVALEALESDQPSPIRQGLTALAFVGTIADLPVLERLAKHPEPSVTKECWHMCL
jgi:hypothetical protein